LVQNADFTVPTDLPPIPGSVEVVSCTQNFDYTVPVTVSAPESAWTPPPNLLSIFESSTTVPVSASGIRTEIGTGNVITIGNYPGRVYLINEHANQM